VKQAEALLALNTVKATSGSFRRPAPKASTGLAPELAAYLEHAS
jgi:allantoin racemase